MEKIQKTLVPRGLQPLVLPSNSRTRIEPTGLTPLAAQLLYRCRYH
jgi:hypothetical protein